VDLVAHENIGPNEKLLKSERVALAQVLYNGYPSEFLNDDYFLTIIR